MHTCKDCMFCYYRDLRIAAFGAVDRVSPVEKHDVDPGQPSSSTPPAVDVEATSSHALEAEVA